MAPSQLFRHLFLREHGLDRARSVRRFAEQDVCDRTLLQSVAGGSWAPLHLPVEFTTAPFVGEKSPVIDPSQGVPQKLHSIVE